MLSRSIATLFMLCLIPSIGGCSKTARQETGARSANEPSGPHAGMILIKGNSFAMGAEDGMPDEAPNHKVTVRSFWIDTHEVTVSEFTRFVAATQ